MNTLLRIFSLLILFSLFGTLSLFGQEGEEIPKAAAPNDPLFPKQKLLFNKLKVLEAWELTKGSPELIIGVVDTGFDFFHPDLKEKLTPGFYANGGYHSEIYELVAHGTLVASLIGAKENNGIGITGLAPGCPMLTASLGMIEHKLLKIRKAFLKENPGAGMKEFQEEMKKHLRELKDFGKDWVEYQMGGAAEGIRWLVDHGARVINISALLTQSRSEAIEKAFAYAAGKDVIIVIGAGNNAREYDDYPGDGKNTIVAGACSLKDKRWEMQMGEIKQGSNFGKRLTVMAPSQLLVACQPHEKRYYASKDSPMGSSDVPFKDAYEVMPEGATSSATPIVTSLVALVRSLRPDLKAPVVIEIIKKGCDDIGEKGYDIYTGHGRVNFLKTLKLAQNWK